MNLTAPVLPDNYRFKVVTKKARTLVALQKRVIFNFWITLDWWYASHADPARLLERMEKLVEEKIKTSDHSLDGYYPPRKVIA